MGEVWTMKLYLLDATYELFRAYYAAPKRKARGGVKEAGAVYVMLASLLPWLAKLRGEALGAAFDHVIESFRNELYPGYKSSVGVPPDLLEQIPLAEDALSALGLAVWPMVDFEADDAIATAAARFGGSAERVFLVSPDKDFAQCVCKDHIVQLDRRSGRVVDEKAVVSRFGIQPKSVPDWLALVGDAADGIPGIPGWGPRSATVVLRAFGHIENVPLDASQWGLALRNKEQLAQSLRTHRNQALLFKTLATLREDAPLPQRELDELQWMGTDLAKFNTFCQRWGFERIGRRARELFASPPPSDSSPDDAS